jgi:hypothetical protein
MQIVPVPRPFDTYNLQARLAKNRKNIGQHLSHEPLIIARVENGVTKFSPQRQKTQKKSKRKLDQENSFPWGIFIFLAAGKLTFLGWGYNFKTG